MGTEVLAYNATSPGARPRLEAVKFDYVAQPRSGSAGLGIRPLPIVAGLEDMTARQPATPPPPQKYAPMCDIPYAT